MRKLNAVLALLMVFLLAFPSIAQMQEPIDYDGLAKIKDEGFSNQTSKVMEIISYLTDVYGPRLTNSPNTREAAAYTTKLMTDWGLANVHLEPWATEFGRGWANEKFYAMVLTPHPFPLIAYPKAWTPGTNGPVTGEVVIAPIQNDQDLEKYKGQLKGKFVITVASDQVRDPAPHFTADAQRYTEQQLADLATQPVPVRPNLAVINAQRAAAGLPPLQPGQQGGPGGQGGQNFQTRLGKFLADEGVLAWIENQRGDDGTVFVQGGADRRSTDPVVPRVALAAENFGRIYRILQKKITVTMEMNIQNKFYDADKGSFNIVGEIPGTDKADEVVMLGAHFDSWHGGTGATDNGAGSAVMLEAMRILKATGLKMRRTVRIGLWTGEEQGLLGSRAYTRQHFAEPSQDAKSWVIKPEQAKLSGYFNVDNGTGKIRGVYLQGNEAIAGLFSRWMEPFHSLGMTQLTIRNTGGTDHLAFDGVGIPGFQFIQDEMDYDSRTHHSNMDVYERIQEADMKQMAVIVASFVYLTANRAEKLPRKPMPRVPQGPGFGGGM